MAIFLIGPGGAGKTTAGALLAKRLGRPFIDLDHRFAEQHGDISRFVDQYGYGVYARANVDLYASLSREGFEQPLNVVASLARTLSGVMPLRAFSRSDAVPSNPASCKSTYERSTVAI